MERLPVSAGVDTGFQGHWCEGPAQELSGLHWLLYEHLTESLEFPHAAGRGHRPGGSKVGVTRDVLWSGPVQWHSYALSSPCGFDLLVSQGNTILFLYKMSPCIR